MATPSFNPLNPHNGDAVGTQGFRQVVKYGLEMDQLVFPSPKSPKGTLCPTPLATLGLGMLSGQRDSGTQENNECRTRIKVSIP